MKRLSSKGKVILLTFLTIFVLFTTCIASFAWFITVSPSAPMDTISGSMDIQISRVSAYRYVYPYFNSSNSYIDYTREGKVKEVVLKDTGSKTEDSLPTSISNPNNDSSYHLVGNKTFLGDSSTEFSIASGLTFSGIEPNYELSDVTVSAGSIMTICDGNGNIILNSAPSDLVETQFTYKDQYLTAVEAGRYSFILNKVENQINLTIEAIKRDDDSILAMTLFDPTYAKLYSKDVASAIYDQNTLLIYDVTLNVQNESHDFTLSCDVRRAISSVIDYPISNYLTYRIEKADASLTTADGIYNHFHSESENGSSKSFPDTSAETLNILSEKISSSTLNTECHYFIALDYKADKLDEFMKESNLGKSYDLKRDYTFYFSSSQIIHDQEA